MHPLRTSVGQVSRQLNRNNMMNSLFHQHLSNNSGAMSLFPSFGQEISSPIFRLFDQHSRQSAFPGIDRQQHHIRSFSPRFDVKETKEGYELQGELPGVLQKDINIEWIDDTTLTISGRHEHIREEGIRPQALTDSKKDQTIDAPPAPVDETSTSTNTNTETQQQQSAESNTEKKEQQQHEEQTTQQDKYWVSERSVGKFQRSFSFPARVDQDAVTASLRNGILSVVVPRGVAPPSKKIAIQ